MFDLTFTGEAYNVNLWNLITERYGSAALSGTSFSITIASGAKIGSTSPALYALTTGTGWPAASGLVVYNYGYIAGCGGNGGGLSEVGQDGGDAFIATRDFTLINAAGGVIAGGGGGGGGSTFEDYTSGTSSGGGGGAGLIEGQGGADGFANNGNLFTGGPGYLQGGAGGSLGTAGEKGTTGTYIEFDGGAAGDDIHKNGKTVSITNNGFIYGTVSETT